MLSVVEASMGKAYLTTLIAIGSKNQKRFYLWVLKKLFLILKI